MSLAHLATVLLSKKDQCVTKKQKVKFVKLALNTIWWTLENFTIDFTIEYLQCIQSMTIKNMEEHFECVSDSLRQFLKKINNNEGFLPITTNNH